MLPLVEGYRYQALASTYGRALLPPGFGGKGAACSASDESAKGLISARKATGNASSESPCSSGWSGTETSDDGHRRSIFGTPPTSRTASAEPPLWEPCRLWVSAAPTLGLLHCCGVVVSWRHARHSSALPSARRSRLMASCTRFGASAWRLVICSTAPDVQRFGRR